MESATPAITLIGARQRDGYEVLAYYEENDSTSLIIGKINVASYPLITHHVIMVPMQAGNIDKSTIDEGINRLYAPYGVTWRLTVDEPFTDRSWDTGYDGLQGTGTEFYSMFTEEMRALNAQYTALRGRSTKQGTDIGFCDYKLVAKLQFTGS